MAHRSVKVLAALMVTLLTAASFPEAPVAEAAMRGDYDAVRSLLQEGADANAAQGDGMTALHWAAERGDVQMTQVLIYAGANVEPVTRIGHYTPLHLAAKGGNGHVVETLIGGGADYGAVTTNSGVTPLHFAAASGDVLTVSALLDAGADPNARDWLWEQAPLIYAASQNRSDAIVLLVAGGADLSATTRTLDLIAESKLQGLANTRRRELLKTFGLEDSMASATPQQMRAVALAVREVFAAGLPKEEAEKEEKREPFRGVRLIESVGGMTPLLHAVRESYSEAAQTLIELGADVNQPSASDGTTPLLMATINGEFDMAAMLLGHGADPNLASEVNGVAPLWAAINSKWQPRTRFPQPQQHGQQETSYLDLAEALLEAGADPDARLTKHPWYMVYQGCGNRNCGLIDLTGSTAFVRAAYATDIAAMRLLVAHGADIDIATKAPAPRNRLTPDEFLRRQNRGKLDEETFAELSDTAKVTVFEATREELSEEGRVEWTLAVLQDADKDKRAEYVEALELADSLRALEPDPSGLPPVEEGGPGVFAVHAATGVGYGEGFAGNAHRHVPDGWMIAAKYLIEELGADVNARDFNGYTAMHHAAARGDNEMIEYLVSKGGDVMVVSRRGQTTVDMANGPVQRVSPFPETVALLEGLGAVNNHNCQSC